MKYSVDIYLLQLMSYDYKGTSCTVFVLFVSPENGLNIRTVPNNTETEWLFYLSRLSGCEVSNKKMAS